jgi:hypothetical protein
MEENIKNNDQNILNKIEEKELVINQKKTRKNKIKQNINIMDKTKEKQTYFCLATEEEDTTTSLEFDLVTARSKGEEIRYLAISFMEKNSNNPENSSAQKSVTIDESGFNELKKFFQQLEWTI